MKKPMRHEVENNNRFFKNEIPEKKHIGKAVLHSKSQSPLINQKLYERVVRASDQKNVVVADIVRMALTFYLDNPDADFDLNVLKDNVRPLQYKISLLDDKKIQEFKEKTGINRSIMIRRALSAWLNHEGY